jgi:hypothetical protein
MISGERSGPDQLTFSAEDFHASPSQSRGSGSAQPMLATSGRECLLSLNAFGRHGSSLKTFVACFLGTGAWHSSLCVLTWNLRVTKFSRLYILLRASVHPTYGIAPLWLPTPTRRDWKNSIGSGTGRHTETLAHWAYRISGIRGPLNPAFEEWMMGFPIGWTECEPSGMP